MWPRLRIGPLLLILAAPLATAQETALPVPVYLSGAYLGEIDAYPKETNEVLLVPSQVIALVDDLLLERVVEDAARLFAADRPVPPEAFTALGLTVTFDWNDLLVRLAVPALIRRPIRLSLAGGSRVLHGAPVRPAPFSMIANLHLLGRFTYETAAYELAATPELVANIHGVALEAQGVVRLDEEPFTFDYARATWDLPNLGYRVQGGDLTWRATRLLNVPRITGLSISREKSLGNPRGLPEEVIASVFQPTGGSVTVSVNESRRYARDQAPGNYEITNVPLGDGLNTVVVSWSSEDGPRQIEIVIPHDGDLLDRGELDAGIAVGVVGRELERPVVSAYQRYGLTRSITLGLRGGAEILDLQIDAGAEAMIATRIGTFVLDPTIGIGPADRLLIDAPLRYYYLDSRQSAYRSFGLSGGYRSVTAPLSSAVSEHITASGYVNLVFPDGFSLTPTLSGVYSLTDRTSRLSMRASLRKSIRGGSALSANLGLQYDGDLAFLATLTYSAAFPDAQQNLFLQQNLNTQELFAFWSRYPGEREQKLNFNVSAKVPMDPNEVLNASGQVGYAQRYFAASLGHDLSGVVATGDLRNTSSVTFRTALITAGGLVGVSAPVTDSFALVTTGGILADSEVRVTRGGDRLGTTIEGNVAVLRGISAYSPVEISVEPTEPVAGIEEQDLGYVLRPTYRSGTAIRVEPTRVVYAGGILLDDAGRPIPYELGVWAGADGESGEFFTDAEGYFEIYGLRPGTYELTLNRRPSARYRAIVPNDASEFVRLDGLRAQEVHE